MSNDTDRRAAEALRPRTFRLWDALTFGLGAALLTLMTILGSLRSENWERARTALVVAWIVACVAWAMYGGLLYMRWRLARSVEFVTRHGLLVAPSGFAVSLADVEGETDRFLNLWLAATPIVPTAGDKLVGVLVAFKSLPFQAHGRPGKLAGLYHPATKTIQVGWAAPLSRSALAHELGHCVYGQQTGVWGEDAYHEFASSRGLP